MDKTLVIGNWKSHKTTGESLDFLKELKIHTVDVAVFSSKTVVLCPAFTSLSLCASFIKDNNLSIKLGAQHVSSFPEGSYTGEVNAKQIKEFAEYVIVGHSESRRDFHESDQDLEKQAEEANSTNLKVIFCVQDASTPIPQGVKIVAYEPVGAIGTGNPDTPENAENIISQIKSKRPDIEIFLYGGSVTGDNVKSFTQKSDISGVLVGGASLSVSQFLHIIHNA